MKSIGIVIVLSLMSAATLASEVSEQLAQCRAVQNDLKRLVCYDKIGSGSFTTPVVTADPVLSAPASASAPLSTSSDKFGVEHKEATKNAASSMTATVAAVEQSKRGVWTITLENGQKWRQISSDGFVIRKGDQIIINRGVLNSFMLSKQGSERQTKVVRLQD